MSQKFYEMQAEVADAPAETPPTIDLYLVAAWDAIDNRWSIRRDTSSQEFRSTEKAEEYAASLNGRWRHRKIIKVSLEG